MDSRAIGVFDSGLGGLTAVKRILELAPREDVVFFGDNARVPYGTRGAETITHFALEDISLLLRHNVKMIIAACATVSSSLPKKYQQQSPLPFLGVVEPTARAAAAATRSKRVGVIGTPATIRSGSFPRALREADSSIEPFSSACPLFVPLVENGYVDRGNEVTRLVAQGYLEPLKKAGVDTVILGCTHYPIIRDIIADIMGEGVTLIDSGYETAKEALLSLERSGGRSEVGGEIEFYVSDNPDGFTSLAELFLGRKISESVHRISLDNLGIAACFGE